MLHRKFLPIPEGRVTDRRIKAAERALRRQREAMPLYAEEIRAEQPTPLERVQAFDQGHAEFWLNMRNFHAKCWRDGRAHLRTLSVEMQARFLARWASFLGPKDAAYFCSLLRDFCRDNGLPLQRH